MRHALRLAALAAILPVVVSTRQAPGEQEKMLAKAKAHAARLAPWVEPDFPFFSSVLDARSVGTPFPSNNLSPRAIVLNLGHDCWAAFDTDLLRVAAIWRGKGVTPVALAPGSYHKPDRKTPGGQDPLPEPDGTVWLANGIYPGWQTGARVSLDDPREPAPSPEEVGRGPLPDAMGRFEAARLVPGGAVLEYTAGGTEIREWITASNDSGRAAIERHFRVERHTQPLVLMLGFTSNTAAVAVAALSGQAPALDRAGEVAIVRVPASDSPSQFTVAFGDNTSPRPAPRGIPTAVPDSRWPFEVLVNVRRSTSKDAYVVDDVALPLENPWRRDVRIADIQFLKDGTGVGVTLDGDVWLIRGLHEDLVRWERFASGLHEPLTLAIRDEQIFVFDRNGIWRLRDSNGDGEADVHELFSNAFGQTADLREFPNTIRLAPNGEFVIAKGNQEAKTLGKHNGRVLRISADGRRAEVLGWGFRQPNLAVNVRTGLVTASDQQGNYVPSTPLHIVRDNQFYGFLSALQPREKYPAPIADPLTWIPHPVNASGMSQVWLFDAKMGALNDSLVHIGFNRPELFRVLLNERSSKPQAAVVSITRVFDFPPLNGSVNPRDGQLYLGGFQILGWGTSATELAGLGRVRYTGAPSTLPREVVAMDKGVLLRFDVELDPKAAVDPGNYSIASWKYERTYKYGSPQLKADGKPGMDAHAPGGVYLSRDRRAVFVAAANIRPVMQMRVGWSLTTSRGVPFRENAYFTPYELPRFEPLAEGFSELTIDLTPRGPAPKTAAPAAASADEGRRLVQLYGCVACHATETTAVDKLGPSLKGLYGTQREFPKIGAVVADEAYLREALLEPAAKMVPGYEKRETGMPSYAGVLTPQQIESIILYIKGLKQ